MLDIRHQYRGLQNKSNVITFVSGVLVLENLPKRFFLSILNVYFYAEIYLGLHFLILKNKGEVMKYTPQSAVFVGALAGAIPVLINLLTVDLNTILKDIDWITFGGYALRVAFLMFLGGFLVYVNSEVDKKKALQLGIMAPAIFIGYINGVALDDAKEQLNYAEKQLRHSKRNASIHEMPETFVFANQWFSLISSAHAEQTIPKGLHREPGVWNKIWYGLTGHMGNSWFIIVGSHIRESDAKNQASALREKGYSVKIFEPQNGSQYYGVMIGSYVTLQEAQAIRARAIKEGLPKDTYLWKYKL